MVKVARPQNQWLHELPGSCHRLDSCHANTRAAIIGALMGLSLTWERGSKGAREGGVEGEECAKGDM